MSQPADTLQLPWLQEVPDFAEKLSSARMLPVSEAFSEFRSLANSRMDFVKAGNLDKVVERYRREQEMPDWPLMSLAVLSSSTCHHLLPAIRLGALRRGLLLNIYVGEYGMYRQELANKDSALHRFSPDAILFCFDAAHLAGGNQSDEEQIFQNLRQCWLDAQSIGKCLVIQQTLLPVLPYLLGNNEARCAQAPAAIVERLNHRLRISAESEGIFLVTVDQWAAADGLSRWHDPALWFRAKQEIHPRASNMFGDQVGRLLSALRGGSAKCLVLDLDNTLWGGVIGDDGLEGIVLGQGSTVGEAHLALQRYALALSRRGIILAVCSKNDFSNAIAPFEQHPEMILRREHIACFVANWQDKATNLRKIAETLHIGLDSIVFVDDNPAERALIRRELSMVAVPELSDDPATYVPTLASAGYFEAAYLTQDDERRAGQYRENAERDQMRQTATDMESFLVALNMKLTWSSFDYVGIKRIVQLANKTNQFNLTTRRYSEAEIEERMQSRDYVTLQLRLSDVYGDNGVISLLVGKKTQQLELNIETWLMSCRVLGRRVEQAALSILVEQARAAGCHALVGSYRPTEKNEMVRDLYKRLGFEEVSGTEATATFWRLSLSTFIIQPLPVQIEEQLGQQSNLQSANGHLSSSFR